MSQKKVPIEEASLGMFIVDMDIPWMDSPFLRHKKKIKSEKDIALLKKAGVKVLTIDLDKSDSIDVTVNPIADPPPNNEIALKATTAVVDISVKPEIDQTIAAKPSFKDQFSAAKRLQGQVSKVLDSIADDILAGGPIQSEAIVPIVRESLSLIDQHNQALLALLHGQRRNKQIQAHSFSVMSLAIGFADQLSLPDHFRIPLATGALLHETGWTRLPLNLFLKGKPFSANEAKLAAQHIPIIAGILKNSPGIDTLVIKTALQHHSAFPPQEDFSVASEQGIAQVLAICNYYDALVHGIGEQAAQLPSNAVRKLLMLGKQGHFQPSLISQFIKYVGIYPIGSALVLSDNSKAIVIDSNRANPMLPKVKQWYDAEGNRFNQGIEIALADDNLTIREVINPKVGNNDPYNLLHLEAE